MIIEDLFQIMDLLESLKKDTRGTTLDGLKLDDPIRSKLTHFDGFIFSKTFSEFIDFNLGDYILFRIRFIGEKYILIRKIQNSKFIRLNITQELISELRQDLKDMDLIQFTLTHGRKYLDSNIKETFGDINTEIFKEIISVLEQLKISTNDKGEI